MAKSSKRISQFAHTFIIAAERCSLPRKLPDGQIEMPLIPGLICRAFSIELNFKAIITQENHTERGHELSDLFDKINESTRTEIINKSGYSKSIFYKNLKEASDTFIKWRYMYEQGSIHCDLGFLKVLSDVAQDISRKVCQE